jgi:hypothetical protein
MHAVFEAPAEMTVTETDSEIVILEKDGRMRTLHPDGKSYKSESGTSEVKSRWDADRLVVETRTERGGKITETYRRDPESHRLTITLLLESPSRPTVSVRRVYDEEEPS